MIRLCRSQHPGQSSAERIRRHLEAEGPVAVALGHWLAGRRDVLPAALCRQLARAQAVDTPGASTKELRAAFDALPEGWFVDPEPSSIRLATQVHRGRTSDGRGLRLELPRAAGLTAIECTSTHFEAVVSALREAEGHTSAIALRTLVTDAHQGLLATRDPAHRVGALHAMSAVPATVPSLEPGLPRGVLCWIDDGADLDFWWSRRPTNRVRGSSGKDGAGRERKAP